MKLLFAAWVVSSIALLSGCSKPEDVLQSLQKEVSAYASAPSDEAAAKIDANFSKLDAQITALREKGQGEVAVDLQNRRDALRAQYAAARMTASLLQAKEAAANVGEAFRKAGEAFGQALKNASTNDN